MKKRTAIVSAVVGAVLVVSAPPLIPPILKDKTAKEERTQATMEEKRANKRLAKEIAWAGYGWRGMQWKCIEYIFTKESRFDHLAKNRQGSSAFGIAQRLKEKSKDPTIQILHGYKYIQHRYETPCKAMKFHLRKNHY